MADPLLPHYTVLFKKSAYKEYKKLPKSIRERIDNVLELLSLQPFSEVLKIKKLRAKESYFRVRVGDYRMIYSVYKSELTITVIQVGHRKEIYNKL